MANPVGRPSKYKPEYCQEIIDFCGQGYSFEAFAGKIKVCVDTLNDWAAAHPEFLLAKKDAHAASRIYWENIGKQNIPMPASTWTPTAWIFLMKSRFQWRDGSELPNTLKVEKINQNAEKLDNVQKQLEELIKLNANPPKPNE